MFSIKMKNKRTTATNLSRTKCHFLTLVEKVLQIYRIILLQTY